MQGVDGSSPFIHTKQTGISQEMPVFYTAVREKARILLTGQGICGNEKTL